MSDRWRKRISQTRRVSWLELDAFAPEQPTHWGKLFRSLKRCPPSPPISTIVAFIVTGILVYITLLGLTGKDALPGGPVFGLFVLVVTCQLGGQLLKILRLPMLVGMMLFGFILGNVPEINVARDIPDSWSETIRLFALILIMLRAGLEIDSRLLYRKLWSAVKLTMLPFLAETITSAVAAKYLLNMTWIWGFLIGTMLAAFSAAVVLPVMLKMQKMGIGTKKGIPTLAIAVAGADDVISLVSFEVLLGAVFSESDITWTIAKGPVVVIVGIISGVLLGFLTWYIPNPYEKRTSLFRFLILLFGGMGFMFGSQKIEWGAMGALSTICLPFVAAIKWKQQWVGDDNPVEDALAFIWKIIEPFLFGLVGSAMRIDYLQSGDAGWCVATIACGVGARLIASMLAAWTSGFSCKEQIFLTFAGLPKATVQAAVGPIPLAMAKLNNSGEETERYGVQILTVAVLAILITAPIGALALTILAPKLLEQEEVDEHPKPIGDSQSVSPPSIRVPVPSENETSTSDAANTPQKTTNIKNSPQIENQLPNSNRKRTEIYKSPSRSPDLEKQSDNMNRKQLEQVQSPRPSPDQSTNSIKSKESVSGGSKGSGSEVEQQSMDQKWFNFKKKARENPEF